MISPNLINIIGCVAAAIFLAYAMKNTHKDDADKMLLNFEWTLLAGLILVALDQLRDIANFDLMPSMASVGVTIMWIASFLFSAHLKIAYR